MYNSTYFGATDLTAVVLTAFVIFFIGLVLYLRREDRREGYPLEDDVTGRLEGGSGLFFTAQPKTFRLAHGTLAKPNAVRDTHAFSAARTSRAPGTPLQPVGDPMLAGVGPGAFAERSNVVDPMLDGSPKIVPLRAAAGFSVDAGTSDPRGMTVLGADRLPAGVVTDLWVDKAEYLTRYLEVALDAQAGGGLSVVGSAPAGRRVLLPLTMADIKKGRGVVLVDAITAAQFAGVPGVANSDQITLYEEERVCAYYGGGYLYATPMRGEPLL